MAISTISTNLGQDQEIWNSLKQAIAKSYGFQRWQEENTLETDIDDQVKQYLRSTLETLAY
ncbi:MAG: hypothetical protein GW795_14940 [Cyanobacteria bacterium]|nr:hypothetical protein [Cyanobacteria bacterium CG_2015-16_32_12]NCO76874.1 hypothetical protein [Cyanobacteria bacterium CG_2015-22_32_23]NCQ03327.1 hypothetical protein [Cyanobacteria bacterium CG_2015-09_32_10]NCQ43122.1 hypothetical protein [Cyanobacteria bacterium CG_2015-04_32_10]NCS84366.1 hypothetical protein [Cyanobacteria bacterium CG_2015-02_32_10]